MPGRRILVVDDDPNVRFLLRLIFESDGYEVGEAQNGVAALLRIKDFSPELVVTDMMMPMMDGGALIEHIRTDPTMAGLKVIVITANPKGAATRYADSVLGKPFARSDLLAIAGSLLATRGPHRG